MIATVTGFDCRSLGQPGENRRHPAESRVAPPPTRIAPPAMIQIGQLSGEFKPKTGSAVDTQHVYQPSEVDRHPTVLFRKIPLVPRSVRNDADSLRVTLLLRGRHDGRRGRCPGR